MVFLFESDENEKFCLVENGRQRVVKAFVGLGIFTSLGVFFLVACFHCLLWSLVNDSGSFGFVMSEKRRAHSCKISKKSEKLLAFLSDVKRAPLEPSGRGRALEEKRLNGEVGGRVILEVVGRGESGQREIGRIKILSLEPVSKGGFF
jgi:hypothetical protein